MAETIVVGLSGGVDSSVAAYKLKEAGYHVVGMFMKNWEDDDQDGFCSAKEDLLDVISVADVLGIDIEVVNFSAEYKDRVFSVFLKEYSAGRTPNPDILCNSEIKFKAFLDHAMTYGADKIATGHYARIGHQADAVTDVTLLKGLDNTKDQSYFLHRLSQEQLSKAMFPVGDMQKKALRELAQKIGLPNARKKDSTGICFIGERPFRAFLSQYVSSEPGPIVTDTGLTIGEHVGLAHYTIGQRKGIGIGGMADSNGEPWFVADKDIPNNTLIVVQGHHHPMLLKKRVIVNDLHWILPAPPVAGERYAAKLRYRQADSVCMIESLDQESCVLYFDEPQWGVTPGQSAVLYDGDVCLGGGVIESAR